VSIFALRVEYAILLFMGVGFGSCFAPVVDKADKGWRASPASKTVRRIC
jgi:hypothetical protein